MSSEVSENSQVYRRVGVISFFTLLSRILGAVRDLVLLHVFGAGIVQDAYVVAQTIPNALRRLTAEGSMTLAVVPVYTGVREEQGQQAARIFARRALGLVLFATVLLTVLGTIFSSEIVFMFASGFESNPEKFQLTVYLTQLMFPYLVFISVVAWAMGILNAEKKFAAPAAAPILLNIGIIFGAVVLSHWVDPPIAAVAIGIVLGGIMQVVLQWPSLRQIGQSVLPLGFWRDKAIRQLLLLLAPSLFGVAVYQINIIVLRTIASTFPDGQVTYYYAASRLTELVTGLFAFSFAAASFPELSTHSAREDWQKMFATLRFAVSGAMFIIIPACIGMLVVAEPIVKMLYLHGAFTIGDANQTVQVLRAFAISIPALAMTRILLPVFYSLKDSRTPVIVASFTLPVTGALGYWFGQYYQVVGLGFGLTCGTWFQAALLYYLLRRKAHMRERFVPYVDIAKYSVCALATCGLGYGLSRFGHWDDGPFSLMNWVNFLSVIAIAALGYFVVLFAAKDPHAQKLSGLMKRLARA